MTKEQILRRALRLVIFDYMVNGGPKCVEICNKPFDLHRPCPNGEPQCTEHIAKFYERKATAESKGKGRK